MSDFFEDLVVGVEIDLGTHTFTADEIILFAERYDPQPFHLDHAAAARSHFGRLAASGWHTAAVWMNLYVAHRQGVATALRAGGETPSRLGSFSGFRAMTWRKPVHAGDAIDYASTLIGKEAGPSPAWGLVVQHNTGTNQNRDLVFDFEGRMLWERRGTATMAR